MRRSFLVLAASLAAGPLHAEPLADGSRRLGISTSPTSLQLASEGIGIGDGQLLKRYSLGEIGPGLRYGKITKPGIEWGAVLLFRRFSQTSEDDYYEDYAVQVRESLAVFSLMPYRRWYFGIQENAVGFGELGLKLESQVVSFEWEAEAPHGGGTDRDVTRDFGFLGQVCGSLGASFPLTSHGSAELAAGAAVGGPGGEVYPTDVVLVFELALRMELSLWFGED